MLIVADASEVASVSINDPVVALAKVFTAVAGGGRIFSSIQLWGFSAERENMIACEHQLRCTKRRPILHSPASELPQIAIRRGLVVPGRVRGLRCGRGAFTCCSVYSVN